ncbi:uncharacterized protein E5676_scaffold306G002780 [Cucumis melo var. makuwa]|uniref:Retrotransposon gag domain-containing protein n=1 Tax=Cucumis melo var. makuwa TaxID=1194695 RepID=A0A5A7TJ69_CUCMM|nr:uncharacterized protein E6C27_scaffold67G004890 [Cucumis melo var. makuwa]TYK17972.1 uncharacterized protein E5676_scaffold306G002780 [Cucumis melo var. makuwa]
MSSVNPSGKAQRDQLVELEAQMLYLVEVPDSIRFLKSRLEEIVEKTYMIDTVAGRVEGLLIQELLARVDTLEGNVGRTGSHERGDSSMGSVVHIEKQDFRATLDVIRNKIADVNARQNLTMRAMANQAPAGGAILVSRVKIPEPKLFCGAGDAKALEIYIFDLKQYFRATNTVTEEAKVTLATMHLSEDAKLWWRSRYVDMQEGRCTTDIHDMSKKHKVFCFVEGLKPWAKTKLYEQRVQDLTSAYAAAERLFDLANDSQDVRRHPSSSSGGNKNNHPSSPKTTGGDKRFNRDLVDPTNRILETAGEDWASLASDSNDRLGQIEREVDQTEEVDNPRMGALKFLSSLQKKVRETNTPVERGLMYVDTWINQKPTNSTMVDFSATLNVITEA